MRGYDPEHKDFVSSGEVSYKDGNRCYWTISVRRLAETIQYPDSNGFYETVWRVKIENLPLNQKHVVFESDLRTQFDQALHLTDIINAWLQNTNSVAMGMLLHSKKKEG